VNKIQKEEHSAEQIPPAGQGYLNMVVSITIWILNSGYKRDHFHPFRQLSTPKISSKPLNFFGYPTDSQQNKNKQTSNISQPPWKTTKIQRTFINLKYFTQQTAPMSSLLCTNYSSN